MPIAADKQAGSVALADVALADVDLHVLHQALSHAGLWLNVGAATLQVRSDSRVLARQLIIVSASRWLAISADSLFCLIMACTLTPASLSASFVAINGR